jgi:hypothetical protein
MTSLKETGCPEFTRVCGRHSTNKGLLLLLFYEQPAGQRGRVRGTFEILASGVGTCAPVFREFMRRQTTAEEICQWSSTKALKSQLAAALRGNALAVSGLMTDEKRLRVFLCHASEDKQAAQELYDRLEADAFRPWLDVRNLVPGQDWEREIRSAIRHTEAVVVLLSSRSTSKEGFVQREIRMALDVADEKPDGTVFLLPSLLEACEVPERLRRWHWVHLDEAAGYERLKAALVARADSLDKWAPGSVYWKPGDDPLEARIDRMSQNEVRAWLHAVGADGDKFPEERDGAWPKTYTYACRVFGDIADI